MAVALACATYRVAADDQFLIDRVESVARAAGRPVWPLYLQALLQLPRCANRQGLVVSGAADALLTELATELPRKGDWLVKDAASSPRLLLFHKLDADKSHEVMRRFHYLRSPRVDGRPYALSTTTGELVAVCVSSPLDVPS